MSPKKQVVTALYDYIGTSENCLSFRKGDQIRVLHQLDSGWWSGVRNGCKGWFPSNYVQVLTGVSEAFLMSPGSSPNYPMSPAANKQFNFPTSPAANHFNFPSVPLFKEETGEGLPPNWGHKKTVDDKSFYYNFITNQTTWDLSNIDPNTGELKTFKNDDSIPPKIEKSPIFTKSPTKNTWNKLLDAIITSIETLNNSGNQKELFIPHSSAIVETIKKMLYASGTAKKDAPIIASSIQLQTQHQNILASLSKLVLAAKLASSVWPPPDAILDMKKASDQVLSAVKQFVATAVKVGLPLKEMKPTPIITTHPVSMLSPVSNSPASKSPDPVVEHYSNLEFVMSLERFTRSVVLMIVSLVKNIRADQSTLLIPQVRTIVTEVGNFLSLVDEFSIDTLSDTLTVDFKVNRLALYNSISGLVMSTQTATSPLSPSNALEQVILATGLVEKALNDLLISIKFLVEEKESVERTCLGQYIEQYARKTSSPKSTTSPKSAFPWTDKLKKFFGDAPATAIDNAMTESNVNENVQVNDIIFTTDGKVKGGSIGPLVERLTHHDLIDTEFNSTFLLTYRSFTTSLELFSLLKSRYTCTPPTSLGNFELESWTQKKQIPIRQRIFNILKTWVETYYDPTHPNDIETLSLIKSFTQETISQDLYIPHTQLLYLIESRQTNPKFTPTIRLLNPNGPPPILPKNMKKIRFLDLDPLEIARQLTIIESQDFIRIQPSEFLRKAWSDKTDGVAENIKKMTMLSNQITGWVAESVLLCKDIKTRAAYIKHFILIADKCLAMNNFNTVMSILAGLNSAPVHRLKRTFDLLSTRVHGLLETLRNLMSTTKNFSVYRDALHKASPPLIPFLGFFLTDLTFIEDGNANFVKSDPKLINFSKQAKTAGVIGEIRQYQTVPYQLTPVYELQGFLLGCFSEVLDENEMYDISLQLEPRERDDEKIARLLTETGFM